jgi:HK97 family phage major capsid protein
MSRVEVTTLREERANLWEQMQALSAVAASEGRDLTTEEYEKYGRIEADLDGKRKHIERIERENGYESTLTRANVLEERDPALPAGVTGFKLPSSRVAQLMRSVHKGEEAPVEELRSLAEKAGGAEVLGKQIRGGAQKFNHEAHSLYTATEEYRDAYVSWMRSNATEGAMPLEDEQRAALNVGTGANGGFTVPVEFYRQLVVSERFFGVMRQLARQIVTADNGDVTIPKVDPANRAVAVWLAEAAAFTESEDQFLKTTLQAFKSGFNSKVSDELLLDSAFDVLGFVAESAGQAMGILANTAYVTGANASTTTPEGLFTKATVGFTLPAGNTASITYAGVVELFHSVLPAYRPRGTFVASDTTIKAARLLTDTQNRPLWQPGLLVGQPDALLGRPIVADPDVAVPAANALCMGFGDVSSAYWIRDVQDITIKVLNELHALNGQVGFRVHRRTDGDIVDTLAFKTLKNSAT